MTVSPTLITTASQIRTPTFVLEIENYDHDTVIHLTRKKREGESAREPLAKFRSHTMRSLIEEDVDVPKRYKLESEEEGTNSKAPMTSGRTNTKDEGVVEKLKGELFSQRRIVRS